MRLMHEREAAELKRLDKWSARMRRKYGAAQTWEEANGIVGN